MADAVERKKDDKEAPEPKNCLKCGSEFFPNRKGHVYCSRKCGVSVHVANYWKRKMRRAIESERGG